MDDDDWYGPDFVADLLLARAYSGAELVGMPSEYHYLAPKDVTVRRGHRAELYAHFVAGGTMLIERGLLREVGSFRPVRSYVDAQLLAAVTRAGAAIYRTHGLGYLLRRNAVGHTWQVDMDYLLDPARVAEIRPGFAPSPACSRIDPSELAALRSGVESAHLGTVEQAPSASRTPSAMRCRRDDQSTAADAPTRPAVRQLQCADSAQRRPRPRAVQPAARQVLEVEGVAAVEQLLASRRRRRPRRCRRRGTPATRSCASPGRRPGRRSMASSA